VGVGMVTPCTNKLKTCEKQAVHTATAGSSKCLSEFSNCSGAGWRRIIGGTVLLVACALGSFYFCCCAQRPASAWGCCCNCCHHMKQQPPPKPVKMVHEPAPDGGWMSRQQAPRRCLLNCSQYPDAPLSRATVQTSQQSTVTKYGCKKRSSVQLLSPCGGMTGSRHRFQDQTVCAMQSGQHLIHDRTAPGPAVACVQFNQHGMHADNPLSSHLLYPACCSGKTAPLCKRLPIHHPDVHVAACCAGTRRSSSSEHVLTCPLAVLQHLAIGGVQKQHAMRAPPVRSGWHVAFCGVVYSAAVLLGVGSNSSPGTCRGVLPHGTTAGVAIAVVQTS
jgi:hypothetical protein